MGSQTWHMESQKFGPWVQNWDFNFGKLHQEKMSPLDTGHAQLVDPGWKGMTELVPADAGNAFSRDFFLSFHFSQHQLLFPSTDEAEK
jgi:hypothetical protein